MPIIHLNLFRANAVPLWLKRANHIDVSWNGIGITRLAKRSVNKNTN
jgi:hypothetical protein